MYTRPNPLGPSYPPIEGNCRCALIEVPIMSAERRLEALRGMYPSLDTLLGAIWRLKNRDANVIDREPLYQAAMDVYEELQSMERKKEAA